MPRNRCFRLIGLGFLIAAIFASPVSAQTTFTWKDAVSGSYSDSGNWSPEQGAPPGPSDNALFGSGSYTVSGDAEAQAFYFSNGTSPVTIEGNWTAFGTPSSAATVIGAQGGSGSVLVGSGSSLDVGTVITIGNVGTGSLTIQDGGKVTVTGLPGVSAATILGYPFSGTLNIQGAGSLLDSKGDVLVGLNGGGTVNVSDGGELKAMGSATDAGMQLGGGSGTLGVMNVTDGGKVDVQLQLNVGTGGHGKLIVNDGTVTTSGNPSTQSPGLMVGYFSGSQGEVSITGTDGKITVQDQTVIGNAGSGTVTISEGGRLESNLSGDFAGGPAVRVGQADSGDGTITVEGLNSLWSIDRGILDLGVAGYGRLEIHDAGNVDISDQDSDIGARIGVEANGYGTLIIDGAGSELTSDKNVIVGGSGTGMVQIQEGGLMSAAAGDPNGIAIQIGLEEGSTGSIEVDADSKLESKQEVIVGDAGSGSLTIQDGGQAELGTEGGVNAIGLLAGRLGNLDNSVVVTGQESKLDVQGRTVIGDLGSASAYIEDGASSVSRVSGGPGAAFPAATIALETGSSADVNVLNEGSSWEIEGNLTVGDAGDGQLNISSGGRVSMIDNDSYVIVGGIGGTGRLSVFGEGSIFEGETSTLEVGLENGTGTINVGFGGKLTADQIELGSGTNSSGTLNVSGEGSSVEVAQSLNIGQERDGDLEITEGAEVTSQYGVLGVGTDATGTANVSGDQSKWEVQGSLDVGSEGYGYIWVSEGGSIEVIGGPITVGGSRGGNITVQGVGSTFGGDGVSLTMGTDGGFGTLQYTDGATGNLGETVLGATEFSSGSITVDGDGSSLSIDGGITIGALGAGNLSVLDSGYLETETADIGIEGSASGTAIIDDAQWDISDDVKDGLAGSGDLQIMGGSHVNIGGELTLGSYIGGNGKLEVSDNAIVQITKEMTVGDFGDADVTVDNMAFLNAYAASVGKDDVTATVTVDKNAAWNLATELTIGNNDAGQASIIGKDGGLIHIGESVTVHQFGLIDLHEGGMMTIGTVPPNSAMENTVLVGADGLLDGTGEVNADIQVLNGGVVHAGNSPGIMNVDGGLSSEGTLLLSIAGLVPGDEYSQFQIGGDLSLGGIVDLDFIHGFAPHAGDVFDLFDIGGQLTKDDPIFQIEGLAPGWQFETQFVDGRYELISLTDGQAIPEIHGVWLLLIASAASLAILRPIRKTT